MKTELDNTHIIETATGEGTEQNAYRHVLWQSRVTKELGYDIALEVGNAHEINENLLNEYDGNGFPATKEGLEQADSYCDLWNNIIGRRIASNIDANCSPNQLAENVLAAYKDEGFWKLVKIGDTLYPVKEKISEASYNAALDKIKDLDEYGFNTQERLLYDTKNETCPLPML